LPDEPSEKESKKKRMAYYRQCLAYFYVLNRSDFDLYTEGDIIAEVAPKIFNKAKTAGIIFPKGWVEEVSSKSLLEPEEVSEPVLEEVNV